MLKIYNTRTRQTEEFTPLKEKHVGMYVCGPTVYGPGHIGHARTYTAFDFIRRAIEHKGYKVNYVVNITDVHDDMIKEAKKQGITIFELADKNISLFMKDLKELGIKEPTTMPRVTQHINEIIRMVSSLQKKGFAYETDDGVYFAISKFSDYGKLGNVQVKKSITGTRVDTDKYEKENAMDFALWKKADEAPYWESPWGNGRPGWHIECSAMSTKYLGEQFDIHGGAVDLVFPHHENEICQSEATYGKKPFVKYWLHAGFLNVRGEKMSKSLGNFITIPELLAKYNPKDFRFFISGLHYRSRIDFNDEAMEQAAKGRGKWNNFIQQLLDADAPKDSAEVDSLVAKAKADFEKAMDEDFNLPNAWASLYELMSKVNPLLGAGKLSKKDAGKIISFLKDIDSIFNMLEFEKKEEEKLAPELQKLIDRRSELKKQKKWEEADVLREELRKSGIELFDTPQGTKWKKLQ